MGSLGEFIWGEIGSEDSEVERERGEGKRDIG